MSCGWLYNICDTNNAIVWEVTTYSGYKDLEGVLLVLLQSWELTLIVLSSILFFIWVYIKKGNEKGKVK